jgi:peptidase C13-like protein
MAERAVAFVAIVFALFCFTAAAPLPVSPFSNWAAVVVAGDHEASDGSPSEGFDNARRDVSHNLLKLGFTPANLAEFSTRPREYRAEKLLLTRPNSILRALQKLTVKASGGCLLYFSSHGEDDGLIVGEYVVPPHALAEVVDHACGARPTVVIISACFSGLMLPPLEGPNRMILTAARRDRTSFGCGQSDRYPYFDQCVLEVWNAASGFPDLAVKARACVATREKQEHLSPASEPQLWIGPQALASLPRWH